MLYLVFFIFSLPLQVRSNSPIGSGVTEAACKVVVKQRLCVSGARWSDRGSSVVLSLRTLVLTAGHWEAFWKKYMQYGGKNKMTKYNSISRHYPMQDILLLRWGGWMIGCQSTQGGAEYRLPWARSDALAGRNRIRRLTPAVIDIAPRCRRNGRQW